MTSAQAGESKPIWSRVRDFFSEDDGPGAKRRRRYGNDAPAGSQQFESTLRDLITEREALATGKVHFLNLAKLKKKLGSHWPRVSGKVHDITQSVLRANLSKKDCYTIVDGSAYLIVFDQLAEDEAKLKCVNLARIILTKLLGESADFEMLELRTAVAQLDGKVSFEKTSLMNALETALNQAHPVDISKDNVASDENTATPGGAEPGQSIAQGLSQLLQAAGGKKNGESPGTGSIEDLLDILREAEAGLDSLPPYDDNEIGWDDDDEEEEASPAAVEPNKVASTTKQDQEVKEILKPGLSVIFGSGDSSTGSLSSPDLVFSYLPIWHVPRAVVSGYLGQIGLRVQGEVVQSDQLLPQGATPDLVAALDNFVLRQILSDLPPMLEQGTVNALIVPVHYSTLVSGLAGERYLRLCNAVPEKLRRFIVFEVISSSDYSWHSQLHEAVSLIKRFSRAVLFRCGADYRQFEGTAASGIFAVGVDLAHSDASEAEILRRIEGFATRANKCELRTYLHGLDRKSDVTAAVCAGFSHIGGPAVSPYVPGPRGIVPFSVMNLYSQGL